MFLYEKKIKNGKWKISLNSTKRIKNKNILNLIPCNVKMLTYTFSENFKYFNLLLCILYKYKLYKQKKYTHIKPIHHSSFH